METVFIILAAGSSALLGGFALYQSTRSVSHRFFAAGMILLTAEIILGGIASATGTPGKALFWFKIRTAVAALVPGTWLLFALSFGEINFRQRFQRWRWVVLSVFGVPLLFGVFFPGELFSGDPYFAASGRWVIPLAWAGYVFDIIFILCVVVLMIPMENTLRLTRGIKRWQVKFLVLGILGYFAVRIYSASQAVLFRSMDLGLETTVASAALILSNVLIAITFIRARVLPENIYLSGELITRSIVLLVVGGYLIVVGFLVRVLSVLKVPVSYTLVSLMVFMALVFLGAILLSNRARFVLKETVSRHFTRPRYNYRRIWMTFTEKTASARDIKDLAGRISSLISELLEVLTVNVLLFDERKGHAVLAGSTSLSGSFVLDESSEEAVESLKRSLKVKKKPFMLNKDEEEFLDELGIERTMSVEKGNPRYCVPLWTGAKLLGFISLDDRVRWEPLGLEELELLGTIGHHAATSIQNLELSGRLQEARELEALRKFSAFFVHDLKNVTTKLSMMLQNFPEHYDNPEFRRDALSLFRQSVDKLNVLAGRMAQLREAPSITLETINLKNVVQCSIAEIDPPIGIIVNQEHENLPSFPFDGEQIAKVVTNLALNAIEAVGEEGVIDVKTYQQNGWIILEVADNGPGMEEDFMTSALFHPFKTTKFHGLGIGLFQCRTIVEAHGGKLLVRSQAGEGAAFLAHLPRNNKGA